MVKKTRPQEPDSARTPGDGLSGKEQVYFRIVGDTLEIREFEISLDAPREERERIIAQIEEAIRFLEQDAGASRARGGSAAARGAGGAGPSL